MKKRAKNPFKALVDLYKSGFKSMTKQSKTLWIIATVKILILFGLMKVFFFPNFMKSNFKSDKQRIEYIQQELTGSQNNKNYNYEPR